MNSRLAAFTRNEISKSRDVNRLDGAPNKSRLLFPLARSIRVASIIPARL